MQIVQVLVEYGVRKLDKTFTYVYLKDNSIKCGTRVKVNFNNKDIIGYVLKVEKSDLSFEEYQSKSFFVVKEILEIIDEEPLLNEELNILAKKISSYYFSPLISVYQAMLPPSLRVKKSSLKKPKISYNQYVRAISFNEDDLTDKQIECFRLIRNNDEVLKSELKPHLVKALLDKKKIEIIYKEKIRLIQEKVIKKEENILNDEQKKAVDTILESDDLTFLLEGVTGSGKTEVYLHLAKEIIKQGKQVLMLVPEISLTHQMVKKFSERFDKIAILHSLLTPSEKYDEYRLISQNKVDIVIGARSAIFAPLNNIGLIIIDEEHSDTYKQEVTPYYSSNKVSLFRQEYYKCKIVFGSATPRLETKTKALKGIYHQLYLYKRFNSSPLPKTQIVDMSDYHNIDNDSIIFSKLLREKIKDRLDDNKQIILLINKRGYAPYIQCAKCRLTLKCPDCGLVLSYHQQDDFLKCHHCGHVEKMIKICPKCNNNKFYKIGFGSEKVEEEVKRLFPSSRVCRIDSDVASLKEKVKDTLEKFSNHEYDIMIGTQMIAKGHDFNDVTLVGVVLADIGLNIPSFNSSEKTFCLLTQAIGRSGRSKNLGEAIIQSNQINNYVIQDSAKQDYSRFFNEEMQNRKINQNPPYVYLILMNILSKNENDLIDTSYFIKNYLDKSFVNKKVFVIGPSEPFVPKINGKFARKILIKFKNRQDVENVILDLLDTINKRNNIEITINVDPESEY